MKKIFLKNKGFDENFTNDKALNFICNCIGSDIGSVDYRNMNKYLEKNYNVNINQVFKSFKQNLKLYSYNENDILIELPKTVRINNYNLEKIINLIDYGNREVKGLDIFNRNLSHFENDIDGIYFIYVMRKGSKIWQ